MTGGRSICGLKEGEIVHPQPHHRYAGSRSEKLYTHSFTSRIFSNTYEFFQIYFNFAFFFFSIEKTIKSHEIWICPRKKTRHYTQEVSG